MIGEKVSHYRIIEKLGGGGMGIIYKAQDLKLDRFVALKFLPPAFSMNEDFKQSIIEEAKIAATLDHPNICTIHEVGETEDEQIFIAMSYYEGETLKKKIQNNSIDKNDIESIVLQIAKGLEQAHENGIVHRDIKPENIFITRQNEVKILDFGVAKIAGDFSVMDADKVKGTIAYMSPEQISGQATDHRTDIWAFGVLLYELITGKKPFSSQYEQSALFSIMNDEPDLSIILDITELHYLNEIVAKCLKKKKEDRFQSVSEIFAHIINAQPQFSIDNVFLKNIKSRKIFESIRLIVLSISIIIIIAGSLFIFYPKSISMDSLDYILVSDFENKTNNKLFDYALSEAIAISLRQSPHLKILPRSRVNKSLSLMNMKTNSKIDENTAIKIAMREETPFIIAGVIEKIEANYVLTASIINVKTAEKVRIHIEEVESTEEILEGIDNLAVKIRDDLGESKKSISKFSVSLPNVTTPSIEALDLYSRGTYYESIGKYSEAIVLKEKALSFDSTFVVAISDLSYDHYKAGNLERANYYHTKILPLVNRVSEREKLSILVVYYGPTFEMDFQKCYESLQKWVLLYPNDALGYAQLGHFSMFTGDFRTAYESNKKAMDMEPSYAGTSFNNTGFAHAMEGDPDIAIEYFKKSKNLRPDYIDIDIYIARALWMKSELDSAISILDLILSKTRGIEKAKVHVVLGSIYYSSGQLELAIKEYDKGIRVCSQLDRSDFEAYFHYLKAEVLLAANDRINYNKEMKLVVKQSRSPFIELALAGISYSKIGEEKKTISVLNKLKDIETYDPHFTKRQNSYINYIQANIAGYRGNYKKALEHLVAVVKLYCGDPIYLMAQKEIANYTSYFDPKTSVQLYYDLLNTKGEIFTGYLPSNRKSGDWIGKIWYESHYELGLSLLKIGDTNSAKTYLTRNSTLWERASKKFIKNNSLIEITKKLEAN